MLNKLEEKRNRDLRNQKLIENREIRRIARKECEGLNKVEIIQLITCQLTDGGKSSIKRALKVYDEKTLILILCVIRTRDDIKSYGELIKFMKSYKNFSKDINIQFKGMNAKSIVNYIKSFSPKRKNHKLNHTENNVIKIDK